MVCPKMVVNKALLFQERKSVCTTKIGLFNKTDDVQMRQNGKECEDFLSFLSRSAIIPATEN
jgi:hypothetical protein